MFIRCMNKTTKKLDNNVVTALTLACETAKQWHIGFEWLTHTARYNHFPGSLMITCVFHDDEQVERAVAAGTDKKLRQLIQGHLLRAGIKVKDIRRHVRLDSEQRCIEQHHGDWQARIAQFEV